MKGPEPAKRSPQGEIHDTALRSFTGYNLKRAYLVIEAKVHRILKAHDLRVTSFSALGIIIENPRLTQTALANALDIERSSTVVIVDALEGRELITRNRVEGDRRTYALVATLRGKRLFDTISAEIHDAENRLQAALSEADRETLTGYLRSIEEGARAPSDE